MPRYHVHFATNHLEPLPPVAELPSVDAVDPPSAVEVMLAAGRYPQRSDLRWARVVTAVHPNGVPKSVARFQIHVGEQGPAIDWNVGPGTDPVF